MAPPQGDDGEVGGLDDASGDLDAALYRHLFEDLGTAIAVYEVITDGDGEAVDCRFLRVNGAFEECTGLDAGTVEGEPFSAASTDIGGAGFIERCGEAALEGETVSFEQHADQPNRYYDVTAFPLGEGLFAATFADATERRRRNRRIEQYEAVLSDMNDGVVILDGEYCIEYVNPPMCRFFEQSLGEFRGRHLFDDFGGIARNASTLGRLERTLDGLFAEPTGGTDSVTVELPLHLPTGKTTVQVHCSRLELDSGPKAVLIVKDITEHKHRKRELARTTERLDSFASRMAHELRNPLTVMSSRLTLARESGDPEHYEYLERSLNRMERLIDDLLVLAADGEVPIETVPIDLGALASVCWDVIRSPAVSIKIDTDTRIVADEDRLRQLLENLFRNAVEHGSTGRRHGSAVADTRDTAAQAQKDDGGVTVTVGDLEDGFYVEDDGCGIHEHERAAMLEQGVTDIAHGTGLGLTIVRETARAHGWTLTVGESDSGGARFEFRGVDRQDR
jgi:signal transduction histidine kinase